MEFEGRDQWDEERCDQALNQGLGAGFLKFTLAQGRPPTFKLFLLSIKNVQGLCK